MQAITYKLVTFLSPESDEIVNCALLPGMGIIVLPASQLSTPVREAMADLTWTETMVQYLAHSQGSSLFTGVANLIKESIYESCGDMIAAMDVLPSHLTDNRDSSTWDALAAHPTVLDFRRRNPMHHRILSLVLERSLPTPHLVISRESVAPFLLNLKAHVANNPMRRQPFYTESVTSFFLVAPEGKTIVEDDTARAITYHCSYETLFECLDDQAPYIPCEFVLYGSAGDGAAFIWPTNPSIPDHFQQSWVVRHQSRIMRSAFDRAYVNTPVTNGYWSTLIGLTSGLHDPRHHDISNYDRSLSLDALSSALPTSVREILDASLQPPQLDIPLKRRTNVGMPFVRTVNVGDDAVHTADKDNDGET